MDETTKGLQQEVDATVQKTLRKRGTKSLEPAKDKLRNLGKERMRIGHFYICDLCDNPIYNPEQGFIVHGNLYVADPSCRGGLVGNNFPQVEPGTKIEVDDVRESVFCVKCFFRILNIKKDTPWVGMDYDSALKKYGDKFREKE